MKSIKEITIGSSVFFSNYKDFNPKDKDILVIMDSFLPGKNCLRMSVKERGEDVFMYRNLSKDEFINDTLNSGVPMKAGKFLVPEFIEYIGLEIDDLLKLKDMFENMDKEHKYETIIYNAYVKNKSFTLTSSQRSKAYKEYKSSRGL